MTRIQIVFSRKPDGVPDAEFDEWYDAHLHEILAIPGFVSARRFKVEPFVGSDEAPEFTHIALYEVEGDFETLAGEMARMHLDTADAYVKLKQTDTSGPPLPSWWDAIRFGSWNGTALGDTVTTR